ncbi:MAG: hypothetical protein Kow0025_12670 [Thermodesulfovibrionales bacterium]
MDGEDRTRQRLIRELRALQERIEELKRAEAAGKRQIDERDDLITQLRDALSECIRMSGLLPVCVRCGQMRDDEEYWDRINRYVEERSSKEPTLALCPRCQKETGKRE